jgi:hypothetical protein
MLSSVRNAPDFSFFASIKVVLEEVPDNSANAQHAKFDKFVRDHDLLLVLAAQRKFDVNNAGYSGAVCCISWNIAFSPLIANIARILARHHGAGFG